MSIQQLDLNLLSVLHTVLATRNVARAAARLHVTPSAVSNSLARLREQLGDPLLTRRGRGLVPTARALELEPILAQALSELERAVSAPTFDPATCTRTFTLAVADVGQLAWVPRLALAFSRQLPRANLRIVNIDGLLALGDLASPEVDLHAGIPSRAAGIHAESLSEEPFALVARRAHPAARGKLSRKALAALRHVRVEMLPGKNLTDPLEIAFTRAKLPRNIAISVPSFTAALAVVAMTDYVTLAPTSLLGGNARVRGLQILETTELMHKVQLYLCWHERTHGDAAARYLRDLVRRCQVQAAESPRSILSP